jgi:hypothetical protein
MAGRITLLLDQGYSSKNVGKHHMELFGDASSIVIYNHGDFPGVHITQPHENTTMRISLPPRKFPPMTYLLIQDITETSPNMKVN